MRRAQPLAFERQIAQFVGRIEDAVRTVELQAVDDNRFGQQAHMLRPQVAVTLDDAALPHAGIEQFGVVPQESQLGTGEAGRALRGQPEFRAGQFAQVVLDQPGEVLPIGFWRDGLDIGRSVEAGQPPGQPIDFGLSDCPAAEQMVEHAIRRQPPHPHQPVHRLPLPAEVQAPSRIAHQRNHPEVDIGRQTAVEPNFPFAVQAPRGDRAEIEIGIAHRLLQLVDMAIGEEHPGHVGLHRLHPYRRLRVGIRPLKKDKTGFEGGRLPWHGGSMEGMVRVHRSLLDVGDFNRA